ncbi:MAG: hypothetical protein ACXWDL_00145 [Nocardioides sp.]
MTKGNQIKRALALSVVALEPGKSQGKGQGKAKGHDKAPSSS